MNERKKERKKEGKRYLGGLQGVDERGAHRSDRGDEKRVSILNTIITLLHYNKQHYINK